MEFNINSKNNLREAINVINHYEEIMKIQNKKIIGYVAIQGTDVEEVQVYGNLVDLLSILKLVFISFKKNFQF